MRVFVNKPSSPTRSVGRFVLPVTMRDEIVAHAREDAPRECCGLIGGKGGVPTRLFRMANLEAGVSRYRVDDGELFRIYRGLEERGGEVLAIYHSHPVTAAYPSPTDVELATWPDALYVICSLEDAAKPVVRAFRIIDQLITEVEIALGG